MIETIADIVSAHRARRLTPEEAIARCFVRIRAHGERSESCASCSTGGIFPKDIVEIGIGTGATISTEPNGEAAPVGSADPSNKP